MYFHSSAHWGAAHDLAEAARDESLAQVFAQFSENGDTVDRTRIGEVTWRAAAQLRASMHDLGCVLTCSGSHTQTLFHTPQVLATTLPTATISQELTDKMLLVADLDNNGTLRYAVLPYK